jgi:hypothetical protein
MAPREYGEGKSRRGTAETRLLARWVTRREGRALKCCLISLAVLTFTLSQATAQDLASQIVGVWKVVDTTRKEVASGKIDKPYGEKPTGYYIYTRAGHFSWSLVAEGRKPPSEAVPTDAERVALFNTMSFGTGTYRVEGSKVVHRYDSFSHQAWTGTERTAQPAMSGAKMTVTSAPFKAPYYGCRRVRPPPPPNGSSSRANRGRRRFLLSIHPQRSGGSLASRQQSRRRLKVSNIAQTPPRERA